MGAACGGLAAGLAGAVIFALLAGGLAFDWGLVLIAAYIGWTVAQGVKLGGRTGISRRARRLMTLSLALIALTAGEVGTWLWARSQGGDLPLLDHLWTVYGPLIVVQYGVVSLAAIWSAG